MFTWTEIAMFFGGFLYGIFYWRKEIQMAQKFKEQAQYMRNAQLRVIGEKTRKTEAIWIKKFISGV